jgi:hypothetical protein
MVTITLDELIRKTLHKNGLPLHYYLPYLLFAKDGLKELKFTVLPCDNTVELTLDSRKEATLPADFVGEVAVYKAEGDKLIELPHNYLISTFDSPSAFPKELQINGADASTYIDEFGNDLAGDFGRINPRTDGYRIIPELNKIRLDNNSDLTKVYLKYVTLPKKTSNKTLVHPFIEPALTAYINWQVAFYTVNDRTVMLKRAEYYNQRRLAKINLYKINITDILTSFRMYHNQAVKS